MIDVRKYILEFTACGELNDNLPVQQYMPEFSPESMVYNILSPCKLSRGHNSWYNL